jgi:hypothetical protein
MGPINYKARRLRSQAPKISSSKSPRFSNSDVQIISGIFTAWAIISAIGKVSARSLYLISRIPLAHHYRAELAWGP